MNNQYNVALCAGRHEIKTNEGISVPEAIYEHIENPMDFDFLEGHASDFIYHLQDNNIEILNLYITGLTPALTSFLALASTWQGKITLWHFDRDTFTYKPQYFQNWM